MTVQEEYVVYLGGDQALLVLYVFMRSFFVYAVATKDLINDILETEMVFAVCRGPFNTTSSFKSGRLGCSFQFQSSATPVSELRRYIRNCYRMTKHLLSMMNGGNCLVCGDSLYHVFSSKTLIGSITTTIETYRHARCVVRSFPVCSVARESVLYTFTKGFTGLVSISLSLPTFPPLEI